MPEINLSGVAPLRRAEARRRVGVIQGYLRKKISRASDREAAAKSLGLGTQQFLNLVKAWRIHGRAAVVAKSADKAGAPRKPSKRGLPLETRAAAEEALRQLPTSASYRDAVEAVTALCRQRKTRAPSSSMISYLRLAARRSAEVLAGNNELVVGRAVAQLPIRERGMIWLPVLVLMINLSNGSIPVAALIGPDDPAPDECDAVSSAIIGRFRGKVTIGADDAVLAAYAQDGEVISAFSANRLLGKALGRWLGGIRLSYGPLASFDPKRALRAQADEPLNRHEALEVLRDALINHNVERHGPKPWLAEGGLASNPRRAPL